MADPKTEAATQAAESNNHAPPSKGGGGIGGWLPLIFTIVAMPALAYATTTFYIVPQIQRAAGHPGTPAKAGAEGGHGESGEHGGAKSGKQSFALNKLIVNVAGTMGTRYLMTSLTVSGTSADFKTKVEDRKDELLDLANTALSNKTISELEKPGARNVIRAELLSAFNGALGENVVEEIFITEFAIQ